MTTLNDGKCVGCGSPERDCDCEDNIIETDFAFLMAEATDCLIRANALYLHSVHDGDMDTAFIAVKQIEEAKAAWQDARDNWYI